MSTATAPGKVYTTGFWLMCLSSFLFFLSFNLLIPELPAHLTSLGGGEYKGYIIALFTVTAAISRPFSGKLADTVGRIPVMVIGTLVCFVCGFLYAWATTVFTFLALRLLHGFSTGFKPTGTAAFIADIIPVERRGEAMGLLGVCGTLGMAVGPALCGPITEYFSINVLFYVSSGLALLSVLVQGTMTETLNPAQRQKFHWGLLRIEWHEVLEPRVLKPAVVTLLCLFPYGAIVTIVPDQSQLLGLTGLTKGSFFICYTISTLAVRLVAGRASDIYGRVPVLRLSSLALVLALVVLTLARTPLVFLIGAVLFGLASGLNSPTLYAWTVDLSHPEHRGRAVGTMYIALEVGIMFGALLAGWVYSNDATRLPLVYALSAACVLGALVYLYRQPVQRPAAELVD